MKELLNTLSIPLLIQIALYPLLELNQEIDAITLNRHRTRSTIKIFLILLISTLTIYYAINNLNIYDSFAKIVKILNITEESQFLVSRCLIIIACCNSATYATNVTVHAYCRYYFGDPEFYVTPKQLIKLEQKFKEQINYEIQGKHIVEVIDFCVKNLRKQGSREIGAKKEDWINTLESLIYDGDAEHFLDQQKALYLKRQILENKLLIVIDYTNKSYNYPIENQPQKQTITPSIQTYGSINNIEEHDSATKPVHKTKIQHRTGGNTEIKVDLSENTPLLSTTNKNPCLHYNSSIENFIEDKSIIETDSKKKPEENTFNSQTNISTSSINVTRSCIQVTPPITPPPKSRDLLIEYQKNLLKQQSLRTNQQILPIAFSSPKSNSTVNNEQTLFSPKLNHTNCILQPKI